MRVWDGLKRREEGWKESDERMETIASSLRDVAAQADRKHNIAVAKVDELRKNMQNLREDIEFYQNLASQGKA